MRNPGVRSRGSILLLSLIAIAILMVLVVGAIRFTGENREAAVSKLGGDRVDACAEVARQYLLGKLRVSGLNVTDLQLNQTLPSASPNRSSQLLTGHYSGPDGGSTPEPTVVVVKAENVAAARQQIRGMESVAPASATLGGQYYRVVVKCQEGPRESELEFVFRYGL